MKHHLVGRSRRWIGVGTVTFAAIFVAGASGVSSGGTITTIAGNGKPGFSGDGGSAVAAQLRSPGQLAVDRQGNVYIADSANYRVRKVSPGGTITTFAGRGGGFTGGAFPADGSPATSARLDAPHGVAADAQGNVYISDINNGRVYKVSPGGTIATFAGLAGPAPSSSFSGDGGPATSARLYAPQGLAVDGQGNVYIADSYNGRVRKVSPGGTITTFAGTGKPGPDGDGGPATSARLQYPSAVAADAQGNVYITGLTDDNRVRKVSRGGTITTFAGGGSSFGDGGPATSAQLHGPVGVAVDGQGNVYIADSVNARVRKVSPGGTITTFAGTGAGGYSGDGGPATSARLFSPHSVAMDRQGNVYIADTANYRVRKVTAGTTAAALTVTLSGPTTQPPLAQQGITVTATCNRPCSLSATGSVTILGTHHVFGLTGATAKLASGKRTLTLHWPAAQQKRFRTLLKPGQQARAVIMVKAADEAGNTATSKRTVAALVSASPASTGGSAAAKLQTLVGRIETVLEQSAVGRHDLGAAITAGFNCSISPRAAARRIGSVAASRRSIFGQLGSLETPMQQAAAVVTLLRQALQQSIEADRHYRDGFGAVAPTSGCPLPPNTHFTLAKRSDSLATAAKQRFAAVFNPLAKRFHRRTWSASEI
jgi:sugar lactone lactonase YvrE